MVKLVDEMELVIFIGVPASGKSTFYKQRFVDTHIRINLDMLHTRHRENILVEACLTAKQPFVVDKTNVTQQLRANYISKAQATGCRVIGYYFQSKVSIALERNAQREGKQCVPDKGILGMAKRLDLPSFSEGFDQLFYVCIDEHGQFIVEEWQDGL